MTEAQVESAVPTPGSSQPPAASAGRAFRADIRLLQALFLSLAALALLLALIETSGRAALAGVAALAAIGLLLARAGRGAAAAALGLAACFLSPYYAIWTGDLQLGAADLLAWLVLGLGFAGLVLPPRWFALFAPAQLLLLAGSLLAVPVLPAPGALRFMVFVAFFTVVSGVYFWHRDRREQQHRRALERLERASQVKGDFLSRVGQELRAPLNVIGGMAGRLERTPLSREQRDYSRAIRRAAARLLRLVDDVLDVSGLESEAGTVRRIPFSLSALVGETARALAPHAEEKGLRLLSEIGEGLHDRVVGDPDTLRRVLEKLVESAVKLSDRGEVALKAARAGGEMPEQHVEFTVSGAAGGTDPSPRRSREVAGLALTIAGRLVALMGSRIDVAEALDKGARFSFTVPLGVEPQVPRVDAAAPLRGQRVLLLLENPASEGRVIGDLLRSLGMEATTVGDVESAQRELGRALEQSPPYALIVVDSSMRGSASFRARRSGDDPIVAGTPKVMLWSQTQAAGGAQEPGPRLLRPVTRPDLLAAVQQALAGTTPEPIAAPGDNSGVRLTGRASRVIVIEPSPVSALVTTRLVELAGYEAVAVGSPEEALAAVERRTADAVLFDASRSDHRACVAKLQETHPGLTFLGLVHQTAGAPQERPPSSFGATLVDAPLGVPELQAALTRALRGAAAGRPARGTEAPFDRQRLVHNLGDDDDAACQVLDRFVQQSQAMMSALREAGGSGDPRSLEQSAHRLKGALLWIAADRGASLAGTIEALASKGEAVPVRETLGETLDALALEIDAIVAAVGGGTGSRQT